MLQQDDKNTRKILDIIKNEGFYIFRNQISDDELDIAKKYFKGNKVNYNRLKKEFIEPHMLNKVGNHINKNLINIKYRASNNNNSADAGSFHRDLHVTKRTRNVNIYTILTYLDGGIMELIPTSNKNQFINIFELLKYWRKKKLFTLNPGDILIFEMTMLHRGIFYKKQKNRRLIQLFDTVYEEDLEKSLNSVLHISCKDKCSKFTSNFFINRNKHKLSSNIINAFGYYNSAYGYGRNIITHFLSDKQIKYLSTESNQPRANIINNTFQPDNLYIINYKTKDILKNEWDYYKFLGFVLNLLCLLIMIITIIIITILILYKIIRKRQVIIKNIKKYTKNIQK